MERLTRMVKPNDSSLVWAKGNQMVWWQGSTSGHVRAWRRHSTLSMDLPQAGSLGLEDGEDVLWDHCHWVAHMGICSKGQGMAGSSGDNQEQ